MVPCGESGLKGKRAWGAEEPQVWDSNTGAAAWPLVSCSAFRGLFTQEHLGLHLELLRCSCADIYLLLRADCVRACNKHSKSGLLKYKCAYKSRSGDLDKGQILIQKVREGLSLHF